MTRYYVEGKRALSVLPIWIKWLVTGALIAHGIALGLLEVSLAFDASQLGQFFDISVVALPAHSDQVVEYLELGVRRSNYLGKVIGVLGMGVTLGTVTLLMMWAAPCKCVSSSAPASNPRSLT